MEGEKKYLVVVKLKDGRVLGVENPELANKFYAIFNSNAYDGNYLFEGNKNKILKKDIESVEMVGHKTATEVNIENRPAKRFWWKVRMAYNNESENLFVDQDELLKVQFAFITGSNLVLKSGSIRGKDIISILPDLVVSSGFNRSYAPTPEIWAEINGDPKMGLLRDLTEQSKIACSGAKNLEEATGRFLELTKPLLALN